MQIFQRLQIWTTISPAKSVTFSKKKTYLKDSNTDAERIFRLLRKMISSQFFSLYFSLLKSVQGQFSLHKVHTLFTSLMTRIKNKSSTAECVDELPNSQDLKAKNLWPLVWRVHVLRLGKKGKLQTGCWNGSLQFFKQFFVQRVCVK